MLVTATWYRWAPRQDRRLHRVATLITFKLGGALQNNPASTVSDLRSVLASVENGVFLADPPGQKQRNAPVVLA